MLMEESSAFARHKDEVGYIKNLKMDIRLTDDVPVAKTYNAIPRPLYDEVKSHIQDLLNKGFIRKSTSPYASAVVCVRKRDGSLRLCINYRGLNKKTIPDKHPIPHIQEILDGLGGNTWFTVLDQGKAYHQGSISEDAKKFTASRPHGGCTNGTGFHLASLTHPQLFSVVWKRAWKVSETKYAFHI